MTFIIDRTLEDVVLAKRGSTDEEVLSRGTLRPSDFARWKEALTTINSSLSLPDITYNTLINCTNPTVPLTDVPEGVPTKPINDCWYYWQAINNLKNQLPSDHKLDLDNFPASMDNLTFANVNALESVIKHFYDALNK